MAAEESIGVRVGLHSGRKISAVENMFLFHQHDHNMTN
jgi:hypothetical protein